MLPVFLKTLSKSTFEIWHNLELCSTWNFIDFHCEPFIENGLGVNNVDDML